MKWQPDKCEKGDIIRVRDGSVYHYGIFVSENEVIAFGYTPSYYSEGNRQEKIVVLATTASEFANGNFIEKGIPEGAEKYQMRSRDNIVACARKRLGEDGYNILHNNCEHFAYECAFGIKKSLQEEEMRRRWYSRNRLDVYICFDGSVQQASFIPKIRQQDMAKVKNEELSEEKKFTWSVLEHAIVNSFHYDVKDIKFEKKRNGKWVCDKLSFSLSHIRGAAVAAVSTAPCGVDIENIELFRKKCVDEIFCQSFAKKIGCASADPFSLIKCWVGKESVYKARGKGSFVPCKILIEAADVRYIRIGDCIVAAVGEKGYPINFYLIENGRSRLMLTGDYECILY